MQTTKTQVYHESHTETDENGEVKNRVTRSVTKVPRTPDFIMLFTKQIGALQDLNKTETSVLFGLLQGYVTKANLVFLSSDAKKKIAKRLELRYNTVHKSVSDLISKNILVEETEDDITEYHLNPFIFGKGNWEDIYKMRHEITLDFDFKTHEMSRVSKVSSLYGDDLLEKSHSVVGSEEHTDKKGVLHQELMVEETHPNQSLIDFEEEASKVFSSNNNSNDELALLKEQNKSKELAIEEMKLKLEMKKEGLL